MTTIVTWKTNSVLTPIGNKGPAVCMIADSRVSIKGSQMNNTLTDRCAKLFIIDINVDISGDIKRKQIGIAVAGNTLVAHNCIFCIQNAFANLVGSSFPKLNDITEFIRDVAGKITKDVGQLQSTNAISEFVVMGENDDGEYLVISVQASANDPSNYIFKNICDFPYVIGCDADKFKSEYFKRLSIEKNSSQNKNDQLPLSVFDKLFIVDGSSDKTGGEVQIITLSQKGINRIIPQRWVNLANRYQYNLLYGIDIFKVKIGDCSIAVDSFQLDDID